MAHLFETRDVPVDLSGVEKICRVACIGDSMMYGQGVLPRHTLPAHLNSVLNAAFPHHLVWCDNNGQSSGNIWNAWDAFRLHAADKDIDALVFSICQNDSQVFDSNTVRYHATEKLQYWLPGTPFRQLVDKTLAEVKSFCDERSIKPIVLFYSFVASDAPIIEILKEICYEVGIAVLDMLNFFQNESGVSIREYCASPFDGHPSSLGHEACARHIARIMLSEEAFSPDKEVTDRPLSQAIGEACETLIGNGAYGPQVAFWAEQALTAKQTRFRRLRNLKGKPELGDAEAARQQVNSLYGDWFQSEVERSLADLIAFEFRNAQSDNLVRLHANARNLGELAYCAEIAEGEDLMQGLSGLLASSEFFKGKGRLITPPDDWPGEMARRAERAVATATAADQLRTSLREGCTAASYLGEFSALCRQAADGYERFSKAVERRSDEIGPAETLTFWQVSEYCARGTLSLMVNLWKSIQAIQDSRPEKPMLFTQVAVLVEGDVVEGQPPGACNMLVIGDYVSPTNVRRRDKLWAGVEYERYLHVFELPLMLAGDLRVGLPDWDPLRSRLLNGSTRISRIEVRQTVLGQDAQDTPVMLTWESTADEHLALVELPGLKLF